MIRRTQNKAEGAPPVPCRPHHTLPRRRRADVSCDQGRGPAPRTSVDAQKQDFGRTASLTNLCLECDSTSLFVLNAEPGEGNIVSILYSPGAPHWRVDQGGFSFRALAANGCGRQKRGKNLLKRTTIAGRSKKSTRSFLIRSVQRSPSLSLFCLFSRSLLRGLNEICYAGVCRWGLYQ